MHSFVYGLVGSFLLLWKGEIEISKTIYIRNVDADPNDYEDYRFYCCTIYYTWENEEWYVSKCRMVGSMSAGEAYDLASSYVSEPNRNGSYNGETVEKKVWIWC